MFSVLSVPKDHRCTQGKGVRSEKLLNKNSIKLDKGPPSPDFLTTLLTPPPRFSTSAHLCKRLCFLLKILCSSEFVVVRDLELEGSLPHAVTVALLQTIPGKQIQVDIVSSPSTEIAIDLEESTSNYHEDLSSTNKHVRKSCFCCVR
jgi:hypothetical protein